MPTTSKNSTAGKNKTYGNKTSGQGKSPNSKSQGAANVKVPTAREKAKNFDEGRRNDAYSNEL